MTGLEVDSDYPPSAWDELEDDDTAAWPQPGPNPRARSHAVPDFHEAMIRGGLSSRLAMEFEPKRLRQHGDTVALEDQDGPLISIDAP